MLFKKTFIVTLVSFLTFSPLATAIEDGSGTPTKKDNSDNSLSNKCNFADLSRNKKAFKYLNQESQIGKLPLSNQNYIAKLENSPKEIIDEVWQIIYKQYVDPNFNQVDWLALRNKYLQKSYQDYAQAYGEIREMLSLLEDPLTRFMTPEEFGELTGERKKANMKHNQSFAKVSNNQNSPKTIEIAQQTTASTPSVVSEIKDLGEDQISYIRLTTFDSSAASKMQKAINKAESQQVSGYILDLRSNTGGLLYSSINIARMFLNQGIIVNTLTHSKVQSDGVDDPNEVLTDKPLTVLINGETASGTEILASALQENNRATLVGETTSGQGTLQSVRPLSNGSGLAVTIGRLFTPNCNEIEGAGITPEVLVKPSDSELSQLATDSSLFGTTDDTVYSKAVEQLRSQL